MQQKTWRIYLNDGQLHLTPRQRENLFWIKSGRAYVFRGGIVSEPAARGLRWLQEIMPVLETGDFDLSQLEGAEECFYIDPTQPDVRSIGEKFVSVRQAGQVKIGAVRIYSAKIGRLLLDSAV
jgi:hypothetical protein